MPQAGISSSVGEFYNLLESVLALSFSATNDNTAILWNVFCFDSQTTSHHLHMCFSILLYRKGRLHNSPQIHEKTRLGQCNYTVIYWIIPSFIELYRHLLNGVLFFRGIAKQLGFAENVQEEVAFFFFFFALSVLNYQFYCWLSGLFLAFVWNNIPAGTSIHV